PMLAWSLRWNLVLAFGLVGLWTSERRGDDRILAYFLLATLAGLMYATVIGRFRLVPAAVLLVYAGGAVAWVGRQGGARPWGGGGGRGRVDRALGRRARRRRVTAALPGGRVLHGRQVRVRTRGARRCPRRAARRSRDRVPRPRAADRARGLRAAPPASGGRGIRARSRRRSSGGARTPCP